jgi:putative ABC transport system permease protein
MLIPKLALRNILSAGLRTWLNVAVLSIAFVLIIWTQGLINGMSQEAMTSLIDTEYGGGQFWHQAYDPYDPLTLEEAHASIVEPLHALIVNGQATPILMTSGAIFPGGRVQTILLKGIDPEQHILKFPSVFLRSNDPDEIPALIGARMAKQTNLKIGDLVTVRWRDIHGTFDATDLRIVQMMNTNVRSVDNGQVWIPLAALQNMLQAPEHATLVIVQKGKHQVPCVEQPWVFRNLDYLLNDVKIMVDTHKVEYAILYALLLGMAMLAIFDTQVLAIFRRRKEMGTLMALGMPRGTIIGLFTVEGALHGMLAILVGAVYGIPLLAYSAATGLTYPEEAMDQTGFALPTTLYPSYGVGLVIGTTLLVLVTVTIVSFLPTCRIVKLKPTEALKGKFS